jgi:hypothetical protein
MQNFAAKSSTLEPLTENIIKKVTLRFFRNYYKFRLRYEDQPVTAKYDLEGVGGIVADGYYSFKKADGKPFTATFEATSRESRNEVIFRPQQKLLFWDGLAVTSVAAVFFAGLNFQQQFHALDNTRLLERFGLLAFFLVAGMVTFYFIAKNFRRYRYIYAIEQFKKYTADEQWIALASDVFQNGNDKNFRELKNQCVFNGFGLLTIDENLDPKIVITPSRQDIFMGKRKKVEFLPQGKMNELVKGTRFGLWWGLFGNALPDFLKRDTSILRFRRSYHSQMLISALSFVLLGVVFSRELQNPNFREVEKQAYLDKIAKSKSNNLPEEEKLIGDTVASFHQKKKADEDGYWLLKDTGSVSRPAKTEQAPVIEPEPTDEGEVFVSRGGAEFFIPDCTRFYNFEGKKYIIQEGAYHSWDLTNSRLEVLYQAGYEPMAIPRSCFSDNATGFIIFLGMIYNSDVEAKNQVQSWKNEGLPGSINASNWQIRPIIAPVN